VLAGAESNRRGISGRGDPEGRLSHSLARPETWNGVAILSRGTEPVVTRTQLPGDPTDTQSRYIEGAVNGIIVACIYLPNGNPQPGPKFDYKLAA
jgi:exonuclease III